MKAAAATLLLAILCLSWETSLCQSSLTCEQAEDIHIFALQTLGSCEDPATQDTAICGLIGQALESNFTGNVSGAADSETDSLDQLSFISNPVSSVGNWQNYLTQNAVTSVADIGEVAYILSQVSGVYDGINSSDISSEDYFSIWSSAWWDQADFNLKLASEQSNGYDNLARMATYWKASNYLFTGAWPFAFTEEAISRSDQASDAFKAGLSLHPSWKSTYFNVTFDNGTASAQLPGIFITPDATSKLPLFIITTGTDFTKEETFLQAGRDALARGYAVLVYEGPGQGAVLKKPPYMPFYAQWEDVLLVVLDYIEESLSQYVQIDKIASYGLSLGGYLGTRGCAGHSDRLAACLPNPPSFSVTGAYNKFVQGLGQSIYAPFLYVAENDPALLPEEYQNVFDDYDEILETLLLTCNASSQAPGLITETFISSPGVIDPELVYLASGYGGTISGDANELYSALWQGFNNVQAFSEYAVENITCPVIAFKGSEDDLLGGQEDEFFDMLSSETQEKSVLIEYIADSGGALHCQVGSPYALASRMFAALNPIFQGNATPAAKVSPSRSPAALPVLPKTAG